MCRDVLATDKRFSNVVPRHPRGGPDGGRDIEARYRNEELTFGAVGFMNQANNSAEQKKVVQKKFKDDLDVALANDPKPRVFVFFTNNNFTVGEKDSLISIAKSKGFSHAEIFDRERIRMALDSTDGFAIRFQYLGIALSEAEQSSFFARWGDEIQSVIATGFQRVESSLDRILFLQEVQDVLSTLFVQFELDRTYAADEINHFRAFCYLHLKEPKLRIFEIVFGSTDRSQRTQQGAQPEEAGPPGIKDGIAGGAWERHIEAERQGGKRRRPPTGRRQVSGSSSIGMDSVRLVTIAYAHDHDLIRPFPRLSLKDFDDASWIPMLNRSLAEKIRGIHVYANGYKLHEYSKSEFYVDPTSFEPDIPVPFTEDELRDGWVRLRPQRASSFRMSFSDYTPRRLFNSPKAAHSLSRPTTQALPTTESDV